MEAGKLQATAKQSYRAKNKAHPLELTNQKHNDIWSTHNRDTS